MQKIKKIFFFGAVFYLILLSACQSVSLWEPQKYKRDSQSFNKVVTNRNQLVMCTSSAGKNMKSKAVEAAEMECAKFGKRAVFQNYSVATCPLSQPVSWHFRCVAP